MTPAQQVLIKGIMIASSNVEEIFSMVEKRLKVLEERISEVAGLAQDQIDEQAVSFNYYFINMLNFISYTVISCQKRPNSIL